MEYIMTKTNVKAKSMSKAVYNLYKGVPAKLIAQAAQVERDPAKLALMLAHAEAQVARLTATHPSRARRWASTVAKVSALVSGTPTSSAPVAATFVTKPVRTTKPKASKTVAAAPKDLTELLKTLGMTRNEAITALAKLPA